MTESDLRKIMSMACWVAYFELSAVPCVAAAVLYIHVWTPFFVPLPPIQLS